MTAHPLTVARTCAVFLTITACTFNADVDVDIPPLGTTGDETTGSTGESSEGLSGSETSAGVPDVATGSGDSGTTGSADTTGTGSSSDDGSGSTTGDPVCEIKPEQLPGADALCWCDDTPVAHQTAGPCGPCKLQPDDVTCLCPGGPGPLEWCVVEPGGCLGVPLIVDGLCLCEAEDGFQAMDAASCGPCEPVDGLCLCAHGQAGPAEWC
jgi:hypothetical protein